MSSAKTQTSPKTSCEEFKAAILGGGAVGKSCITIQYIQNIFVGDYDPTIEDSFRKVDSIDGRTIYLDLLDTAGQDEFRSLRDGYMRNNEGFIAVYDITNLSSFTELVQDFLPHLLRVKDGQHFPLIVVGNKIDLETERQVNLAHAKMEIEKLMQGNPYVRVMECSAKKRINIDDIFVQLIREYRNWLLDAAENTSGLNHPKRKKSQTKSTKPKKHQCVLM